MSIHSEPDEATEPASTPSGRVHWHRLLTRRLMIAVSLPTAIGLFQLTLALIGVIDGSSPVVVVAWLIPALAVGFVFGSRIKTDWHDERAQLALVRGQILLTLLYVAVRIGAHITLEETRSDARGLADALLIISAGLFLGRTLGLGHRIRNALTSRSAP